MVVLVLKLISNRACVVCGCSVAFLSDKFQDVGCTIKYDLVFFPSALRSGYEWRVHLEVGHTHVLACTLTLAGIVL